MKRVAFAAVLLAFTSAAPAAAQMGGRLSLEPYVGYGFFGGLPNNGPALEADLALGGRVAFQLAPQWSVFGNFQRSTPEVTRAQFGTIRVGEQIDVDHWSAGVEFAFVPRGGAEGMLPILMEAGLGQVRYQNGPSDTAANIGIGSALRLSPNFAIRYGANDYISNYRGGDGIVNHIFVRIGAELTF